MKIVIERNVVNAYKDFLKATALEIAAAANMSETTRDELDNKTYGLIAKASEFKSSSMHRTYLDEKTDEYTLQVDDMKMLQFLHVLNKHKNVFMMLFGIYSAFVNAYKGILQMFSLNVMNMMPQFNAIVEDLKKVKDSTPCWEEKKPTDLTLVEKVA